PAVLSSPIRIVLWLSPLGGSGPSRARLCLTLPAASQKSIVWAETRFCPCTYICSSTKASLAPGELSGATSRILFRWKVAEAGAAEMSSATPRTRRTPPLRLRRSIVAIRTHQASGFNPGPVPFRAMSSKRQIFVGGVPIGGGAPVVVQTMTKTETANLDATMEQIRKVADAGADLVRVAVPRDKDVEALRTIVVDSPIPVIADIHFNHTLALKAIDAGAHCIRLNPGNIGGPEKVAEVADRARAAGTPMRIGVNSGSLPKHLHALERENSVEALVTAGVEFVELMERLNFT